MKHEPRIVSAFLSNGIQRILLIDDVFDAPLLDGDVPGELLDFLQSEDGSAVCGEAGISEDLFADALTEAEQDDSDSEKLSDLLDKLYSHFVSVRLEKSAPEDFSRFDPGDRFETLKGASLDVLAPLLHLLKKCGDDVDVRWAGYRNGKNVFRELNPNVLFLDYFLSSDVSFSSDKGAEPTPIARKQSVQLLDSLLGDSIAAGEEPAIVLMSSEGVKARADEFRKSVNASAEKERVLALRFRFLKKDWIKEGNPDLEIDTDAADSLLDTAQGYQFGKVLQQALVTWRQGAENAMERFFKGMGNLGPKDFAYLFRFRLQDEGEQMSDYLEWMFGENIRALIDESVDWRSAAFSELDKPELSAAIEGAFDGPSKQIAEMFHRTRLNNAETRARTRYALGDIYLCSDNKTVRAVVTPDCDLVPRSGKTKVKEILTMGGELRSFDQESASADQFIFLNKRARSLKWNTKDLKTFPAQGETSLHEDNNFKLIGTLRPIYAQEMQRLALTDLSRVGVAVAPTLGVDAKITAWLRVKAETGQKLEFEDLKIGTANTATIILERGSVDHGHTVLLRRSYVHTLLEKLGEVDPNRLTNDDAGKLQVFLNATSEQALVKGFLLQGSKTRKKGRRRLRSVANRKRMTIFGFNYVSNFLMKRWKSYRQLTR